MTAVAAGTGHAPGLGASGGLGAIRGLAKRSVLNTVRQPQMWVPSMVFPLFFAALNIAAMNRAAALPGFPGNSFLDFTVATTVVQGILFGASAGGTDMATDIQLGFFDRLVSSPVSRTTIIAGRLAGAMVLGGIQATVFLSIFALFGANIRGGIPAVLVIVVVGALLGLAIGGLSVAIALKTGSAEVVQATFPIFFASLFASSAFFPRELMSGWFRGVAAANPLTYMIEGIRNLVIFGFDAAQAFQAIVIVIGLCFVSLCASLLALRSRLGSAS
ncbi:MAG: ABC transporter permease [Acidimicrobiales bacterium]